MRAELLERFWRDGFVPLGRLVDDATLATLRARADDLMLDRERPPGLFYQHDSASGAYGELTLGQGWIGPSTRYRKVEKLELDATMWRHIADPRFAAVARAVLGVEEITLYRAMLMNKAARGGTELPWHQDGGLFWGVDRDPVVSIWTALDDATADSGAMRIVPGSHTAGLARPMGGNIPAVLVAAAGAEARAVCVPARAGDVVLLHNQVWHRSGRNTTDAPRRAISCCYLDARTRCVRKKHAPRVFPRVG